MVYLTKDGGVYWYSMNPRQMYVVSVLYISFSFIHLDHPLGHVWSCDRYTRTGRQSCRVVVRKGKSCFSRVIRADEICLDCKNCINCFIRCCNKANLYIFAVLSALRGPITVLDRVASKLRFHPCLRVPHCTVLTINHTDISQDTELTDSILLRAQLSRFWVCWCLFPSHTYRNSFVRLGKRMRAGLQFLSGKLPDNLEDICH